MIYRFSLKKLSSFRQSLQIVMFLPKNLNMNPWNHNLVIPDNTGKFMIIHEKF